MVLSNCLAWCSGVSPCSAEGRCGARDCIYAKACLQPIELFLLLFELYLLLFWGHIWQWSGLDPSPVLRDHS